MSGFVSLGGEMENSHSTGGPMSLGRRVANGRQSPTAPLKIFGLAKKKINDIFVEISGYIAESSRFIQGLFCFNQFVV
jgi:hypothetical protein